MSNPFKIIEPNESAPEGSKDELMGSIGSVVLILRFVQLFMADSTAVILNKFKIDLDQNDQNKLE
jgi:hypothetical protein